MFKTMQLLTRDDDVLDVFVGVVGHAHVHIDGFAVVEGLQEREGVRGQAWGCLPYQNHHQYCVLQRT